MAVKTIKAKHSKTPNKKKQKIPAYLIRETIDGIPFYYKGYRSVLNKTKTLEDIMPDSGLQTLLKNLLKDFLTSNLDTAKYWIFIGEVGSHLDHRSNMGLDIAIYDKETLTIDKITNKYIDVTPLLVVEIDVNIEVEDQKANIFEEYVLRKVKRLHQFGAKKIIWIFTKSQTVVNATPDNNWKVTDLDSDVDFLDNITINLAQFLKENGLSFD